MAGANPTEDTTGDEEKQTDKQTTGDEKKQTDQQTTGDEDSAEDVPLERSKKIFTKELRCMMYGFGDDMNSISESVDLMEEMVVDCITETCKKAMNIGRIGKVTVEDLIFLVRKDKKKYSRVKELLLMNEELQKARKAFDENQYEKTNKKKKK